MTGLTINSKTLDKYFKYLTKLDNGTKKKLIIRLTKSLESEKPGSSDIITLFGAWKDDRSSHEIIKEIRESRVETGDIEKFE